MPSSADWITSRGAAEMTKNENRKPVEPALQKLDQRRNVVAQPHPPAGLDQMLAADAAELGIVTNQIGQLAALLHEVAAGQAVDLLAGSSTSPSNLAEDEPESLKLSVWSKSDATRKCRVRWLHVYPPLHARFRDWLYQQSIDQSCISMLSIAGATDTQIFRHILR